MKQQKETYQKAIVIGASSGIGKELALLLAANGYQVGITGRRLPLLQAIQAGQPHAFEPLEMDVQQTTTLANKLECLVTVLGGLDLLIISSGTGEPNEDLNFQIEQQTIATNIQGFTCISGWAFNYFSRHGYGHLVGISSIAALRGSRHAPAYNASKAYQANYLEGLRQKATHQGIPVYVTDIRPGFVATDMAKGEGLFWVMPATKAARQIYQAIVKKRKLAYITRRWRLVAALLKRLPKRIYDRM